MTNKTIILFDCPFPVNIKKRSSIDPQRDAIGMAFHWWADGGPTLYAGWFIHNKGLLIDFFKIITL